DLLVGHRGVAGREIYRVVDEVLDAGAASFRLIINGNGAVLAAERLEPRRVKREWKARPGAGEPHPLLRRRLPGPAREYRDAGRQEERDRQSFHGWSSVEFLNELPVGLTGLLGCRHYRAVCYRCVKNRLRSCGGDP